MAELFDSYASDFAQLTSSITAKLDKEVPSQAGEARKATLRRADMEADEADEILSQMEIEVNGFPQSVKSKYAVQLRGYKAELEKLRRSVRTQVQNAGAGGSRFDAALEADGDVESGRSSYDPQAQRQRLLQGTSTLEDGSRRLQESHRIALETEDLGADILRDLRSQREQIENSRDTLRQADSNIDRSSRTLSKMIRRAKQQKLVTIGIITVLVLLILLILYGKFS
ncbi:V-snare-domain-containing protein [Acaromyces ingoldii]|uniref:V-snare-domain-containing protein n=1 Tax=Acaromyces ingoldii TaxID=215250 RepID=A0A316YNL3_9BASI|nr:V-snare-domain-containing protein [Acaromyces ingoldii]PWN90811.1 V-snare-domain-containing protein [Acaromyces ingoldii]